MSEMAMPLAGLKSFGLQEPPWPRVFSRLSWRERLFLQLPFSLEPLSLRGLLSSLRLFSPGLPSWLVRLFLPLLFSREPLSSREPPFLQLLFLRERPF